MTATDIAAARALAAGPTYGLTERGAATITALCDEVESLHRQRALIAVLAAAVEFKLTELRDTLHVEFKLTELRDTLHREVNQCP